MIVVLELRLEIGKQDIQNKKKYSRTIIEVRIQCLHSRVIYFFIFFREMIIIMLKLVTRIIYPGHNLLVYLVSTYYHSAIKGFHVTSH